MYSWELSSAISKSVLLPLHVDITPDGKVQFKSNQNMEENRKMINARSVSTQTEIGGTTISTQTEEVRNIRKMSSETLSENMQCRTELLMQDVISDDDNITQRAGLEGIEKGRRTSSAISQSVNLECGTQTSMKDFTLKDNIRHFENDLELLWQVFPVQNKLATPASVMKSLKNTELRHVKRHLPQTTLDSMLSETLLNFDKSESSKSNSNNTTDTSNVTMVPKDQPKILTAEKVSQVALPIVNIKNIDPPLTKLHAGNRKNESKGDCVNTFKKSLDNEERLVENRVNKEFVKQIEKWKVDSAEKEDSSVVQTGDNTCRNSLQILYPSTNIRVLETHNKNISNILIPLENPQKILTTGKNFQAALPIVNIKDIDPRLTKLCVGNRKNESKVDCVNTLKKSLDNEEKLMENRVSEEECVKKIEKWKVVSDEKGNSSVVQTGDNTGTNSVQILYPPMNVQKVKAKYKNTSNVLIAPKPQQTILSTEKSSKPTLQMLNIKDIGPLMMLRLNAGDRENESNGNRVNTLKKILMENQVKKVNIEECVKQIEKRKVVSDEKEDSFVVQTGENKGTNSVPILYPSMNVQMVKENNKNTSNVLIAPKTQQVKAGFDTNIPIINIGDYSDVKSLKHQKLVKKKSMNETHNKANQNTRTPWCRAARGLSCSRIILQDQLPVTLETTDNNSSWNYVSIKRICICVHSEAFVFVFTHSKVLGGVNKYRNTSIKRPRRLLNF